MQNVTDQPVSDEKTTPDVCLEQVIFSYHHPDTGTVKALEDVSLSIPRGGYAALLGRNGSGKSTMAKLINVLELPESGRVVVLGHDTADETFFWEIRRSCGMVFQNPDNQIVGTIVEEDVAFGPENLGIPSAEIRRRVDEALAYVGMSAFALRQPSQLSGGQKQKVAIAGILAMQPQVLLLDESTSMLDPVSRDDFLSVVEKLRREKGMTLIHITHDMSEACRADKVFILDHGKLALSGTPGEVFSRVEEVRALGLDVPVYADIAYQTAALLEEEVRREDLSSRERAIASVRDMLRDLPRRSSHRDYLEKDQPVAGENLEVLRVEGLCHAYEKEGGNVLQDVSFSVRKGEIFAIIGHSGSGKTTLISHLNGLLRPQKGTVTVRTDDQGSPLTTEKNADIKRIRRSVGLLFQYPEYQLFEESVEKDIAFGPKKMGLDPEEIERRVTASLSLVGLDETFRQRSPFELSGGQKRRVALAGVIAMDPEILVLDEPAAGLDPVGRREVLSYARVLKEQGKTVIIVSHNMDEAARYADRILVLKEGRVCVMDRPEILYADREGLARYGITQPETVVFLEEFRKEYPAIETTFFEPRDAAAELIRVATAPAREGGDRV